ncbi:MAG: Nuclear import receptor [Lichina confinis]|nr:MAG: Nuclear import receptor [Lichina confinis]
MQKSVDAPQKQEAHRFLEGFQKSDVFMQSDAWTATFELLRTPDAALEAKLFAATTLKGKILYDFEQVPRESLPALRDSLLSLLSLYGSGPRPIRTQLCVSLASLAIQMPEWKNVLQLVGAALGSDPKNGTAILEFLKVLPEEVTEGRKVTLTEEELADRTAELLEQNSSQILQLWAQYAQSSLDAIKNPMLFECISSWLREISVADIARSPLLDVIMNALSHDASFETAVECLCTMFRETKDVDESLPVIQILYPRIVSLRPRISQAAESEDQETYLGLTRVFSEAGEAWIILIARMPTQFDALVDGILECAEKDRNRDAVPLTYSFWYEMKQYLVLEKYIEARMRYAHNFSRLVDVMINHLEFPVPEDGNEDDLFEGDREQEDRFRENRHLTGDVLKDCCQVLGATECLGKSYKRVQEWISKHGGQVADSKVPHWQSLEAPLFSMRAMGRVVDPEENTILPQLMPLLIQVPSHLRIRFTAIMTLGRYSEWTARHPEFLEPQLNFIISSFGSGANDIMTAAALALKFFCHDCRELLRDHVVQLQKFYDSVLDSLPPGSQKEISEGVANVVGIQPADKIYDMLKLYCDPLVKRLMSMANEAKDKPGKLALADHIQLLTTFIKNVSPTVAPGKPNPAVKYWQEVFPVLPTIVENFLDFPPICERVCGCWRTMVLSFRDATQPLLPALAEILASCFAASQQGCFLWATDAIVREFSEGAEHVDEATSGAIYRFFEQQALTMLRALNDVPPADLPDVIEDFFRLLTDALFFYPERFISSELFAPIFSAAVTALTLEQRDPVTATLHFLRDLLGYGTDNPPSWHPNADSPAIRAAVQKLVLGQGEVLVQRVLAGMMFTFPRDCFPDASGVLLDMFHLVPNEVNTFVGKTIQMLPGGTISQTEAQRLLASINQRVNEGEIRKVRYLLQDFTNAYRRRNVAPRDGLGRLEATRFRFSG